MVNITDKAKCTGCTACANICSYNAITMQFDDCGHTYPVVGKDKCVDCGLCDLVCPLKKMDNENPDINLDSLKVLATYNKDNEVRKDSTSGGIFSVLSEYVISKGGIIYAARFDKEYHILHDSFDSLEEINDFRGSKYAQSELADTFKKIKESLKSKTVLFVGTPCQVAGLKSYLRKEYDNLITCDFICMGISSPRIWDEYIHSYWDVAKIKQIKFKDKREGWHNWKFLIEDEKGEHFAHGMDDPFFYSYLTHMSYRPSCLSCQFRHLRRVSDMTIADCWGIDSINPDFDDNKGCTTLIFQNDKAESIWNVIKEKMIYTDYPYSAVEKYNPYSVKAISKHPKQDEFYKLYKEEGIKVALDKYGHKPKTSIFRKIINKLK